MGTNPQQSEIGVLLSDGRFAIVQFDEGAIVRPKSEPLYMSKESFGNVKSLCYRYGKADDARSAHYGWTFD